MSEAPNFFDLLDVISDLAGMAFGTFNGQENVTISFTSVLTYIVMMGAFVCDPALSQDLIWIAIAIGQMLPIENGK